MNAFSLLSFLVSIIYMYLGIAALRLERRETLNRLFFLLCLCYAVWSFAYVFFYPAPTLEACWFWFRASSLGWTPFAAVTLHFSLFLTNKRKFLKAPWLIALYLPAVLFLWRALTTPGSAVTVKGFTPGALGWIAMNDRTSPWYWAFLAYYLGYALISVILTWKWGRASRLYREKKQARIIVVSILMALTLGTASNLVLPFFGIRVLPSLAHVFIIIWLVGLWYAIVRYRLMVITSSVAAEEIIARTRDMIILINPDGKIIKSNPRTETVLGYASQELFGMPFHQLIHFDAGGKAPDRYHPVRLFDSETNLDIHYQARSGEVIPVSISSSVIRDAGRDVIGTVVVARDLRQTRQLQMEISNRIEAEKARLRSENRYQTIFENSGTAICIIDEDGCLSLVNSEFEKLSGYARDAVAGKVSWKDLVAEEDLLRMLEYERLQKVDPAQAPRDFEFCLKYRDGSLRHCFVTVAFLPDSRKMVASLIDISDLRRVEDALRESQERHRVLLEHLPVGVYRTGPEGHLLEANRTLIHMLDVQNPEVLRQVSVQELYIHKGKREELIHHCIEDSEAPWSEFELRTLSGKSVWVRDYPRCLRDEEGNIRCFEGILINITDRVQAEMALKSSHARLKEVDQIKTDFLSMVSHELRTPLTSVLGFAKIIQNRFDNILDPVLDMNQPKVDKAAQQIRENLAIIISEGNRLVTLINDVLDIAKMEAGKIQWNQRRVWPHEFLKKACQATSALIQQKGLELREDFDAELPCVRGDGNRFQQVVINLISNAVKFTSVGAVTCRARSLPGELLVTVSDTGAGIRAEDFEHVFEKFRQLGDTLSGRNVGSGLGLPICRQIVEQYGGRIWVESTLGKGSIFSFTLPALPEPAEGDSRSDATGSPGDKPSGL